MPGQIQVAYDVSAINLYAVIRNDIGKAYRADTQVFETYSTANLTATKYAIALTEQGTASRYYAVDFPTAIPAGIYAVTIYQRVGGSPAETDTLVTGGSIEWDGVSVHSDAALVSDSGTAQAGGASTITLRSGASASDSYYNKSAVKIVSGAGANQVRQITAYVGATKVATVDTAWVTNPDNTSIYQVLGRLV